MSDKKKVIPSKEESAPKQLDPAIKGITGVARSVQAYDNQGFRNFRIVTLHLEEGVVKSIEYSDPHASFEAMVRMELLNQFSIINLNMNWKNGEMLRK